MKISIIGTGYVGLVSGVCLAAKGHHVRALDIRKEVVDQLNLGKPHIHEAGLEDLLGKCVDEGRFEAHLVSPKGFEGSELILIAVGTPTGDDGSIDLVQIESAARTVGRFLSQSNRFLAVVVKSTVVPGTTDTFVRQILEEETAGSSASYGIGMNPEFLKEGNALEDFMNPDRIVIGADDAGTIKALRNLYLPWDCDKLVVNTRTAEMIKYANNCLLATQISAANELANIASAIGGIDIREVMTGVHLDRRWSPILENQQRIRPEILAYLKAGCGFGGSCFPKDVKAMISAGLSAGSNTDLLKAVVSVNNAQAGQVVRLLDAAFGGELPGSRVLLLGLAFKPGTDDVRESASLKIMKDLLDRNCHITAHDPIATVNFKATFGSSNGQYVNNWQSAVPNHDAIIIATIWDEYLDLKLPAMNQQVAEKVIVDARGLFTKDDFPNSTYYTTIGMRPLKKN